MTAPSRQKVIAGNWKMYKTIEESVSFIQNLSPLVKDCESLVYLAVPFTALASTSIAAKDTNIVIGAQNMNDATEGAFTGEIAGKMLKDAGAKFVIIGHSERRHIFKEGNEFINRKIKRALADGLQVIFCVGETKDERDQEKTEEVLTKQISEGLKDVLPNNDKLIIAYEPVWAIGTSVPATPEIADVAMNFCRKEIANYFNQEIADQMIIQYGGSVKAENAKEFLDKPNIDGLLVGGASLSFEEFAKIVNCYNSSHE